MCSFYILIRIQQLKLMRISQTLPAEDKIFLTLLNCLGDRDGKDAVSGDGVR